MNEQNPNKAENSATKKAAKEKEIAVRRKKLADIKKRLVERAKTREEKKAVKK